MSTRALVTIDRRARAAHGAPAALPRGSFFVAGDGTVLQVQGDGHLEQLVLGGLPWGRSIASDPCAGRGA